LLHIVLSFAIPGWKEGYVEESCGLEGQLRMGKAAYAQRLRASGLRLKKRCPSYKRCESVVNVALNMLPSPKSAGERRLIQKVSDLCAFSPIYILCNLGNDVKF
jgi:hypothetical protein